MKESGYGRLSKNLIVKELAGELKKRPIFFITQHSGLSASTMDELRARLRETESRYFVIKNSLGLRALEEAGLKQFTGSISGACAFVFSSGDPVASSKTLVDFAKQNETFKLQTGYMNGEVVSVEKIKVLASLPSREVLLGKLVGTLQAPIQGFVGVLSGTVRKVVSVLDAIGKKKGKS